MAGDWLKIESDTPDKPEILAIAASLNIDTDDAFGKCFRLWRWFDSHTETGNARGVTKTLLDRMIGVTGFCDAMEKVGWLAANEESVTLPNFERHNGTTAKTRALTAKRVSEHKKSNAKGNAASVTKTLAKRYLEKRREDISGPDGTAPISALDEKICKTIPVLQAGLTRIVQSQPPGSLSRGAFKPLEEDHLDDTRAVVEWHSKQLGLPDPVLGNTEADLLFALAAGLYAASIPTKEVKVSRVAIFSSVVTKVSLRKVCHLVDEAAQRLIEYRERKSANGSNSTDTERQPA